MFIVGSMLLILSFVRICYVDKVVILCVVDVFSMLVVISFRYVRIMVCWLILLVIGFRKSELIDILINFIERIRLRVVWLMF